MIIKYKFNILNECNKWRWCTKPALLDKVKRRIEGEESGLCEWIQSIYLFYIRIAEIIEWFLEQLQIITNSSTI